MYEKECYCIILLVVQEKFVVIVGEMVELMELLEVMICWDIVMLYVQKKLCWVCGGVEVINLFVFFGLVGWFFLVNEMINIV